MSNLINRQNYVQQLEKLKDEHKYILSTDIISSEIEGIEHINIVDWLLGKE